MNRLNRLHAEQQEVCSSIWGQQLRRRGHQSLHPSYKKIAFIHRSKSLPRSGRMRLLTIVAHIPMAGRRYPMKRLVDQETDLELGSKGNWEPCEEHHGGAV